MSPAGQQLAEAESNLLDRLHRDTTSKDLKQLDVCRCIVYWMVVKLEVLAVA